MQTPTAAPQTKHRKHLAKKILASGLQCGAYVGLERLSCDRKVDYQLMRQEDAKWVADEQLTDRLIAVGKPARLLEEWIMRLCLQGKSAAICYKAQTKTLS